MNTRQLQTEQRVTESRHREKIEKAIKESIRDVVAEESIIGQSGKKKIRIPVKGIKEHRFIYGQNEKNKK